MSDPEMDDIVENMLDQPDLSPHDKEVLRIGAEFAARVTRDIEAVVEAYEDQFNVTITQTDRLKIYEDFFGAISDDFYDDTNECSEEHREQIEEILKESSTDYATPG